jgi:hypothetical protein
MSSDQQLITLALREAGRIVTEHLETQRRVNPDETITGLIAVLDRQDLAAAIRRVESGLGLRRVN